MALPIHPPLAQRNPLHRLQMGIMIALRPLTRRRNRQAIIRHQYPPCSFLPPLTTMPSTSILPNSKLIKIASCEYPISMYESVSGSPFVFRISVRATNNPYEISQCSSDDAAASGSPYVQGRDSQYVLRCAPTGSVVRGVLRCVVKRDHSSADTIEVCTVLYAKYRHETRTCGMLATATIWIRMLLDVKSAAEGEFPKPKALRIASEL